MLKYKTLEHRFVKHVPETLEAGVLYVSVEFGSIVHSCCCGCGEEVVTPLTPTDWKMMFDGETVSLWPSVGSWTLKCNSHYIIQNSQVIESGKWTPAQIEAERRRDRATKVKFYGTNTPEPEIVMQTAPSQVTKEPEKLAGRWAKFKRWWKS